MTTFKPGLVHSPVTPFKADHSIDYETYAKLIEFHLHNGAEAIAATMARLAAIAKELGATYARWHELEERSGSA